MVRLLDANGAELPSYFEPLQGRHSDGSIKVLLVQCSRMLTNGQPESATLAFDAPRVGALVRKVPISWPNAAGVPFKAIHPQGVVSAPGAYLSRTRLFTSYDLHPEGGQPSRPSDALLFARFRTFSNLHWNNWIPTNNATAPSNQYGWDFNHYVAWLLTGDVEYLKRCVARAVWFREDYLKPNNYRPAPWLHEAPGMLAAYWATGEDEMRTGLAQLGATAANSKSNGNINSYSAEPRPFAKHLMSMLMNHLVGDSSRNWLMEATLHVDGDFAGNGWITSGTKAGAFWNRIMYSSCTVPTNAELTHNFMLAMKVEALEFYLDIKGPDAAVNSRVTGLLEYLRTMQFRSADLPTPSYNYMSESGVCPSSGGASRTVDLNGFFAAAFAGQGARQNNAVWTAHAELLLETLTRLPNDGTAGPFLHGTKQFNEGFWRTWFALARLR